MSAVILSACAFNSCMQMKSAFCWGTQSRNPLRTAERIPFRLAEITRSMTWDIQNCCRSQDCNLNQCRHASQTSSAREAQDKTLNCGARLAQRFPLGCLLAGLGFSACSVDAPGAGAGCENIQEDEAEQDGSFAAVHGGKQQHAFAGYVADEVGGSGEARSDEGGATGEQANDEQQAGDQFNQARYAHHREYL